ncbi:NifS Cysteine sulfinate desulfinase/cysteine desulfurase and related enzymes [Candidatus Nanopelagicaceae bacterium]
MVRVTGNFASEGPLSPPVREALLAAFDQGWADPKKLSQAASRAAILRNQSIENIASKLSIPAASVEILGEPSLGHFLAIAGFLQSGSPFAFSSIDKGKVRAIARTQGVQSIEIPVSRDGQINYPDSLPEQTTLSLQLANGETGIFQSSSQGAEIARIISVDATASGGRTPLPARWDSALFDARSWNGPAGISILAIANRADFTYPLPHIAPINSPGSYSLPLLIASSIALDVFEDANAQIRRYLVDGLQKIEGVEIVGLDAPSLNHLLSCVVSGVRNEVIVRELAAQGIDLDAGSACSPADLQPSHVVAAMGYPTDGQLRFTLRSETTQNDVDQLLDSLKVVIDRERKS